MAPSSHTLLLALALVAAAPFAFAAEQTVPVSGPIQEVVASSGVDVEISEGAPAIRLVGDAADFARVKISQDGARLSISRVSGVRLIGRNIAPNVKILVSAEGLTRLKSSSGATVTAKNIRADALALETSSGADLIVTGVCARLEASSSSGADLDAKGLACTAVTAGASSGSDAIVLARESVMASASSGGDVIVLGAPPARSVSESSGGDVTFRP